MGAAWVSEEGEDMTSTNITELIGKTLRFVTQNGTESIDFESESGERWRMEHWQDCCECVEIEDVAGDLQDLVGSPIVMAEEATNQDNPKDPNESFTWTFYKLATAKGYVTIRWYGSSNGYYSESVDFDRITP
jgi:hypothetical protein